MEKIQVKNVYKVFGPSPNQMLHFLEEGEDKETLFKKHQHTVGVNNASFTVEEGEIFVIMGLSGSGKSTLIRCMNRLIEPTSGEVYIDGENIITANRSRLTEIRRKKAAMVFQNFSLFPHRNILWNVAYGLEVQKVNAAQRNKKALEMLQLVGLQDYQNVKPGELSGGMQQRVGLARALATDADILLMDEAFSALDPLIRKNMQNELLELQSQIKKTILFITHDLDEALKIGDKIAIMKDGCIIQIGTPKEILCQPADDYVRTFTQDINRNEVIFKTKVPAKMMRKEEI